MRLTRMVVIAALVTVGAGVAALAQSREYRISGTVVDSEQRPIAGAAVEIRERTSRQGFKVKTDAAGMFKLTGLPHGFFEVTFTKAGYQSRSDQWDLSEPQEPMKKVEYNPYVLLSDEQVAARERNGAQEKVFEEAKEKVRGGDTAAALPLLEKLVAERPDDANARFLLAVCHLQGGRPAAAAAELERVIELNPSFAPAHTNLGICREQLGDTEQALASYEAALALDPASPVALYNAGVLRFNAKDPARALPYFEKVIAGAPADDRALEMAGYCELQNGNYAGALAYLERARPLIADPARAGAVDEILKELRPRVQAAPGGKGGA